MPIVSVRLSTHLRILHRLLLFSKIKKITHQMASSGLPSDIKQLVVDLTKKYHIEYHTFLSNHVSHGIYALHYLDAEKETIEKYIKLYSGSKLEPHDQYSKEHLQAGETLNDLSQYELGSRKHYYAVKALIKNKVEDSNGDYKKVVRELFPTVVDGLPGSLIHCLIQLGYGLASECPETVIEGLAYFYHSYVSVYHGDPETANNIGNLGTFGKGTESPLEVLNSVREDKALHEAMKYEVEHDEEVLTKEYRGIQRNLFVLFKHKSKQLQKYVDRIQFPEGIDCSNPDVDKLVNWLVDVSITVYDLNTVHKSDFVILHGVTGAWSLKQILDLFRDDLPLVMRAVRSYLVMLVAVYIARDQPLLDPKELEAYPAQVKDEFWDDIKKEQRSRSCDEHFYKLVQVAYNMWKLNPSSTQLYTSAVRRNLDNHMYLSPTFSFHTHENNQL